MTALTTLNMPVTAPIASPSVRMQVARNPGVRRSVRHAWRTSRAESWMDTKRPA